MFTADHGESMMEHEHWFCHQMNVYEEMVRIPLMVRVAGLDAERISDPVTIADLAPTIRILAALPGGKTGRELDGQSLLRPARTAGGPRFVPDPPGGAREIVCEGRASGGGLWRGSIRGYWKTAARHGMSNVIRESRAFNLQEDPDELHPFPLDAGAGDRALSARVTSGLERLRRLVASDPDPGGVPELYEAGELPAPGVAELGDERMRSRLRSLGYVGG